MMSQKWTVCSVILATVLGLVTAQRNPCWGMADGMFVNDFTSCEGYYVCLGQHASPAQCPPGFYFNEAQQLCDFPQNVFCHVCNQQSGVQLVPYPTECDLFITCSRGISFLGKCRTGETFDEELQACKNEVRVNCDRMRCPVVDNPNVVVFLPGNQSCDEYFICQAGTPIQRFCAPGLHWNRNTERCDFPESANCPSSEPDRPMVNGQSAVTELPPKEGPITNTEPASQQDAHPPSELLDVRAIFVAR